MAKPLVSAAPSYATNTYKAHFDRHSKDVLPMTGTLSIPAFPGESGEGEPYSYPGGLPKPIGRNARIIGRFEVNS